MSVREPDTALRLALPVSAWRANLLAALDAVDRAIGLVLDLVAAVLLVAETVMLASTVVARYIFHAPVTWVDELATVCFLWLGMLGAASAVRRGLHMRLTFVLANLPTKVRQRVELAANAVLLVFLAELVSPAFDLALENYDIRSPDLLIPGSVGAFATVFSLGSMFVVLLISIARTTTPARFTTVIAAVIAAVAGLQFVGPVLMDLGNVNLLIFFVLGVSILIAIGVPIAFSFGSATLFYFLLTTDLPLTVIAGRINEGMSGFILLTIPLFILLGLLMQYTGMAKAMVDFLASLFGGVRGGLGYVLLCAMYLVSGISGAKAADMAAIGPVLVPEMKKRGTPEGDLVAILAVSAAAAETIPPSLVLIVIGSVTGVSIASLFTGGLVPAAVCMLALAAVVFVRSRGERRSGGTTIGSGTILRRFWVALPGLALPFIIRAAVLKGIATATEVATVGIVYVLVVGLLTMRRMSLRALGAMLVETAAMSGALLLIVALAGCMSWALTQSGFAHDLVEFFKQLPGGRYGFMAVSIVAFIVLGSVLEGIPAIVLFGPLLFPAAAALGIHQTHYAIVVLLSMGFGLFSPPFGYGYYTACAIARVSPDSTMRNMVPYLAAFAAAIVLIAAIPWLSTGFL